MRKPLRKVSKGQSARLRLYRAVRQRFLLDNPICQACIPISRHVGFPLKDARWAEDVHHKYGRIGPLLTWTPGFVAICRNCHHYIGEHPNIARKLGLLASTGQWNNTALAKQ
jgi:hypothetical protein